MIFERFMHGFSVMYAQKPKIVCLSLPGWNCPDTSRIGILRTGITPNNVNQAMTMLMLTLFWQDHIEKTKGCFNKDITQKLLEQYVDISVITFRSWKHNSVNSCKQAVDICSVLLTSRQNSTFTYIQLQNLTFARVTSFWTSNPPLAWGIGYIVTQCTDTPNFIFEIKKGGLGIALEVYNYFLDQLA